MVNLKRSCACGPGQITAFKRKLGFPLCLARSSETCLLSNSRQLCTWCEGEQQPNRHTTFADSLLIFKPLTPSRMEGLPFLPGNSFRDPTVSKNYQLCLFSIVQTLVGVCRCVLHQSCCTVSIGFFLFFARTSPTVHWKKMEKNNNVLFVPNHSKTGGDLNCV